ncbi:ATP-binding protein [Alkalicoccus daliensis]|uniref:AAA domain-containing protein n=1 Tax=Alkalicoccus daliensis TaxID=745820 RepID=A0A1H0IF74_9BACI|nr:AAA family ATPase [Alkalicoccus daliensis]SDO29930.1 AAA domain-containing protein [Alkalicoccus daliensis]
MKLLRIQIESFAKWKNQTWELGDATLLFGLNEAGKTTILLFIESVLFGYRTPISDRSAGSLLFDEDGKRWYIERRQGRTKTGEVIVTCNGERMNASDFLNHIDLSAFRHLYRIDLDQLQLMEDGDPEEINRLLFDTSLSGILSLSTRQKELKKNSLDLFKPRGRKTEINVLAKNMDDTKRALDEWSSKLDRYGLLREEKKDIQEKIDIKTKEEQSLQDRKQREELKQLLIPLAGRWKETSNYLQKEEVLPAYAKDSFEQLKKSFQILKEEIAVQEAKIPELQKAKYSQEELTELGSLIESFAKADMYEQQLTDSTNEQERINLEIAELENTIPDDVDMNHIRYSPPLVKRLDDLTEQQRDLKLEEKQLEKRSRETNTLSTGYKWLKFGAVGLYAGGIIALLLGEWVSGIIFALLGTITLLYFIFNIDKNGEKDSNSSSRLSDLQQEWGKLHKEIDNWCDDAGFIYGLDIHTYRYVLESSQKWQELQKKKQKEIKKSQEAAAWITRHKQQASIWTGNGDHSIQEYAQSLKLLYSEALQSLDKRNQDIRKKENLEEVIRELEAKSAKQEEEINNWLLAAGTEDEQNFWKIVERDAELRELKRSAQDTWQQICAVAPNEVLREELIEEIVSEENAENNENIEGKISEVRRELGELYEKKSELAISLKQMEEGGSFAELQQRYEQEKLELTALVKRWAVYETASMLVDDIREVYEKEKQPDVLKEAEAKFTRMTNGDYLHVHVPVEQKHFVVERKDGKTFTPSELSRGTRELLYVALRLALIKEHPALPICIDEALVNMDHPRRHALWEELAEVAENHQVLFFTCHNHIRKEWEKEVKGIVYKL